MISLVTPLKLKKILETVKITITKTNSDYNKDIKKTSPVLLYEISYFWN